MTPTLAAGIRSAKTRLHYEAYEGQQDVGYISLHERREASQGATL